MPALLRQLKTTLKSLFAGEAKLSAANGPQVHALERSGIRAECHRAWPTDGKFREGWDRLCQISPHATTFSSPTWQQNAIGPTLPQGSLRLITARRADELVALLPMELTPTGFLESTGHAVSDYLDPLVDPQHERETWPAIIALIAELWDRELKAMTLHNVRHDSPCRVILPEIADAHGLTGDQTIISNSTKIDSMVTSAKSSNEKSARPKSRPAQN